MQTSSMITSYDHGFLKFPLKRLEKNCYKSSISDTLHIQHSWPVVFFGQLIKKKTLTVIFFTLTSTKRCPYDPSNSLHPILHVILGAGHKKVGLMIGCHPLSVSPWTQKKRKKKSITS